ncbi:uncharacterized protein [Medicago truncatula]|uniref:uncharacterized protein isoform X2 n=1 Tax=Medicago truncatula TaxID=3880 RepID=UPI001967C172|nr:uncharacterized protein LOC25480745 isoform X2 [Medicago truncatula]
MNEKSMQQQRPLGETDIAVKPSQVSEISVEKGTTSGPLCTSKEKTSSQEYDDGQIAITSPPIAAITKPLTTQDVDVNNLQETSNIIDDQVSLNDDVVIKITSIIEEPSSKDVEFKVPKSKLSPIIPSPQEFQTPSMLSKDPSQNVEDLSSSSLVKRELEQLLSKKHLDYENLSLLTDFFVKHPSVRLKDTSLSNRYKGYAYNCLAELLKFLQTHSVLDVLGSSHSEFVELLQDVRKCGFDKKWLDDVEKRALFPGSQVSQDALQKLLDSKHILTQHVKDLKHQLASSEAVLQSITQQEAQILQTRGALSDPIGY